jgi:hypothetical protein
MMLPRLLVRLAPIAFTLAAITACGDAPTAGEATASSSQAILGGTPVTTDTLGTPIVCGYSGTACTFGCSGTMVADRWLLTAHHCATTTNVTTGGTAIAPGGLVAWIPGAPYSLKNVAIYLHPTLDVALVEMDYSVVNAALEAPTTPIWTGASASLRGKTIYCQGAGDTTLSGGFETVTSAELVVEAASVGSLVLLPNSQGQALYEGDSGAGCFLHAPGTPDLLVSVHSEHESPGIGVTDDLEVGADGFESWASSTIASQACSIAGATCGTITDGLGTAVSCGTCGTGDVCSANACVCAPKKCPAALVWNQSTCSCQLTCHSPITCCAAAGGSYIDGHCE